MASNVLSGVIEHTTKLALDTAKSLVEMLYCGGKGTVVEVAGTGAETYRGAQLRGSKGTRRGKHIGE